MSKDVRPGVLDNLFMVEDSKVVLDTASYNCEISTDFGEYLQVFTPPNRKSVAIEPMSCPGNAFNSGLGLQYLSPGDTRHWIVKLKFS